MYFSFYLGTWVNGCSISVCSNCTQELKESCFFFNHRKQSCNSAPGTVEEKNHQRIIVIWLKICWEIRPRLVFCENAVRKPSSWPQDFDKIKNISQERLCLRSWRKGNAKSRHRGGEMFSGFTWQLACLGRALHFSFLFVSSRINLI